MTSTFQFTAKVAPEAMSRVSRLFNASLDDILNELLQNARRAGATEVAIERFDDPAFGDAVRFADNGHGLANYLSLFMLGKSTWREGVEQAEDAAGMGFFSLANRGARIVAKQYGFEKSWVFEASTAAFAGKAPVIGADGPDDHEGVTVIFPVTQYDNVAGAVSKAARFCPLRVAYDGEAVPSEDFLEDALHIEEWRGIRIGIFNRDSHGLFERENVNFHGVTLRAGLPHIAQEFHDTYSVRLDVTHCAALKLVLPARKELVCDDFFEELRTQIKAVIFRHIASRKGHSLSFSNWKAAGELGIAMPEAAKILRRFTAAFADSGRNYAGDLEAVTTDAILFEGGEGPIEEQTLAQALDRLDDDLWFYEPVGCFQGYSWYDALRCAAIKGYRATFGSVQQQIETGGVFDKKRRPDRMQIILECAGAGSTSETWPLETDLILLGEENTSLEEVEIRITTGSSITCPDLVDFLEAALFCPSDDVEAGSYDQQQQWFDDEAEDLAVKLLQSDLDASINAINRTIRRHLAWQLPRDRLVTIQINGRDIQIQGLT